MDQNTYVRLSLELHLFFDRIMKEHSFFLEVAFTEKDKEYKKIANTFQKTFDKILESIVTLANGKMSKEFLTSNEIITKNTLLTESQTSKLSGVKINSQISELEYKLKEGIINANSQIVNYISSLNKRTLTIIENLIQFKKDILKKVLYCEIYTTNYPLLINHIMNEAKMYYNLLNKIEEKKMLTKQEIYEQEIFWNNVMKEHAEFIRGLLDPSETELIKTANQYAREYEEIIKDKSNILAKSLKETLNFRDFKIAGEEGILNCKIKSVIIPLLADHVVREANHFIRILNEYEDIN